MAHLAWPAYQGEGWYNGQQRMVERCRLKFHEIASPEQARWQAYSAVAAVAAVADAADAAVVVAHPQQAGLAGP